MNLKLPKPTVDLKEIRRLYHKDAAAHGHGKPGGQGQRKIDWLSVRLARLRSLAMLKRKMPSRSGTVVLGSRMRRGSGLPKEIGISLSNGMRRAPAFKREHGHRPRVFCASLADAFDNQDLSDMAAGLVLD
jgi:hypothetical protein